MGKLVGIRRRRTVIRIGFLGVAVILAIAAAAWACVAHDDPTNPVELTITDPANPVPMSHVSVDRDKDYVWTATGLNNGDDYEIRVEKHVGYPEPFDENHPFGSNFCGGSTLGVDEYRMVGTTGPVTASGGQISGTNKIPATAYSAPTTGTVYDACVVRMVPTPVQRIESIEIVVF